MSSLRVPNTGRSLVDTSVGDLQKNNLSRSPLRQKVDMIKSFAPTLKKVIHFADGRNADILLYRLLLAETKKILQLIVVMAKADITLKLMVRISDKIVYVRQEIMEVQV